MLIALKVSIFSHSVDLKQNLVLLYHNNAWFAILALSKRAIVT
jgi:hypothetical protein